MLDIVFPNDNENEFLEAAKSLGYSQLIFVYTDTKKVRKLSNSFSALLVDENKVKQYKGKADFIIVKAHEDINRHAIEKMKPDIMFSFEDSEKSDTMHQRYSGLNHVLCSFASQNKEEFEKLSGISQIPLRSALNTAEKLSHSKRSKVKVAFSFNLVLNSFGNRRATILGRISQNISLCRKYKVKTLIASFAKNPYEMRSAKDLQSLFITLGMHPKEAKDAMRL